MGLGGGPDLALLVVDENAPARALQVVFEDLRCQFGAVDQAADSVGELDDDGRARIVPRILASFAVVEQTVVLKATGAEGVRLRILWLTGGCKGLGIRINGAQTKD